MVQLEIEGLTKRFNRQVLFRDLSLSAATGERVAIVGRNGAGKSTLLQIIAGLQSQTRGALRYTWDEVVRSKPLWYETGFVSPVLGLYGELTGQENIQFALKNEHERKKALELAEYFGMSSFLTREFRHYSSGMQQRIKLIIAFSLGPRLLLLDEPGSNLDREGKDLLYTYIREETNPALVLIATNEEEEVALCSREVVIAA